MCLYNSIHKNHLDEDHRLSDDEAMSDEIQLLNEVKPGSSDSDGESEVKKAKLHVKLDEVSLAKSIEDLRRLSTEPRNSHISPDVNIVQGIERTVQMKSGDEKVVEVKVGQRPLSIVSVEIGDYQSAIEDVLEKLLKAEDEVCLISNYRRHKLSKTEIIEDTNNPRHKLSKTQITKDTNNQRHK